MTSLLNFHAVAAARGDGLRPELRALLERAASDPWSDLVPRYDGMAQSGPNPGSAGRERTNPANPDLAPLDSGDAPAEIACAQNRFSSAKSGRFGLSR
jgi:hypothetical protein